jgi:hypothetical protein
VAHSGEKSSREWWRGHLDDDASRSTFSCERRDLDRPFFAAAAPSSAYRAIESVGAEAVPTWDTIVTREVVLMPGMNPRRASISFDNKLVYVSSDRMNRFQTRVGFGGERENYVYKSKGIWAA